MKHQTKMITIACMAGLTLASCQQSRQLTEMHDTTAEMRDTTRDLNRNVQTTNATTGEVLQALQSTNGHIRSADAQMGQMLTRLQLLEGMNASTAVLSQTTAGLCQGSRQALAEQSREPLLLSVGTSTNQGDKIVHAAKYFKAFEFQAWGICGTRDLNERDLLKESAVHEFFYAVRRFATPGNIHPLAEPAVANGQLVANEANVNLNLDASFNAISATLHMMNHLQELMILETRNVRPVIEPVTMYSMLVESLKLNAGVNNGRVPLTSLKPYQRTVLENFSMAGRLLQARQQFYFAAFINELQPYAVGLAANPNIPRAAKILAVQNGVQWHVAIDGINVPKLQQLAQYLRASMQTRRDLTEAGIAPVNNDAILPLMRQLRVDTQGATDRAPLLAARRDLIALIGTVQSSLAPQAR